jgi:hypothetical protein
MTPEYAAANPIECAVDIVEEKDCTDPEYAAANPIECAVDIVEEKDCTDPVYAAQNPAKCGTIVVTPVTIQLMQHQDRVNVGL